jgi:hypothetical protein
MTLPIERYSSVNQTREFLLDLCNPSITPKVPKVIRQRASSLLRHYPSNYDMERACEPQNELFEPVFSTKF